MEDSYSHESVEDDEDDVDYDGVTMYAEDCLDDYNDDDYEEVRMLICCIVCRLVVSVWNS